MKQAQTNKPHTYRTLIYFAGLLLSGFLSIQQFKSTTIEAFAQGPQAVSGPGQSQELRGVWISYLEWNEMPTEQQAFQAAINEMYDNVKNMGMNAVFVHVRSHGDAMYPSAHFPWSKFASGRQGVSPGYDPLAYAVQAAHDRGLEFHAWLNPYRVTGYLMSFDELADSNPAKVWLTDQDPNNDRWVLLHSGSYYFNPAIPEVRQLITAGVKEIVENYAVDGIHFDDYFYPSLDNAQEALWFDKPEYDRSGSALGIAQWRRQNVNELIAGVYRVVKDAKPEAEFGISPAGYLGNLRSDSMLFADVDTWMTQPGYIDYIMPQLYWGFNAKLKNQSLAPYAYGENLNSWINLAAQGDATLYLGLGMYRAGSNIADNNPVSEWLTSQDILKRQVEAARASGKVSGYCFFSYQSFFQENARQEKENLLSIFQ